MPRAAALPFAPFAMFAMFAAGCVSVPEPGRVRVHHFFYGLAGGTGVDVRDVCPSGRASSVEVYRSFSSYVASIMTLGVYFPHDLRLRCVPRAPR